MSTQISLRVRHTYRVTVPGGHGNGQRWSKTPFPGSTPSPDRVVTGRVRREYESVTGETCYVIGTGRSRLDAETILRSEILAAEEIRP